MLLRTIGLVYGLFIGLGGLVPLVYLGLGLAVASREQGGLPWEALPALGLAVASCSLISAVGFALMYAFWARRRWGRRLAISFNSVCMAALIVLVAYARLTAPSPWEVKDALLAVGVALTLLLLPAAITWFCLRPQVKALLDK